MKLNLKKLTALLILPIVVASFASKPNEPAAPGTDPFKKAQAKWVDSVYDALSPKERLGQLFMVAAYSNKDQKHVDELAKLVQDYGIGGLIYFQGGPQRQAKIDNYLQEKAKVKMLVGMDLEWGLGMRLDSTLSFPRQMTMGAINDRDAMYKMASYIAYHCKRLGVHISFSPVADINSNPDNPVIGTRSFGSDKTLVANLCLAYMQGLQDNGILANAKHFPGHGDANVDSHYDLPSIKRSLEQLEETEFYPFKKLIDGGIKSVMVAHLQVPSLEKRNNRPSTLSKKIITNTLRQKLDFEGLIFTDALNMKGVAKFYKPGEVEVEALDAGNDVMLFPGDVPVAITAIEAALKSGKLNEKKIEQSVRRILEAKYFAGLHNYRPINLSNLSADLNSNVASAYIDELFAKSVTIVNNTNAVLPLTSDRRGKQIIAVHINTDTNTVVNELLNTYGSFKHYYVSEKDAPKLFESLPAKIGSNKIVLVNHMGVTARPQKNYGVLNGSAAFVKQLQANNNKVCQVIFGNPYAMKLLPSTGATVVTYEDNERVRKVLPQVLFGTRETSAKVPISYSPDNYPFGNGLSLKANGRLKFSKPENNAMDSEVLSKIDSLVQKMLADKVVPGGQILIARNNAVVYNKNFGTLNYDTANKVNPFSIYDIASVTKVISTTQALMFFYDRKQLDLGKKASEYLPELIGSNKEGITVTDLLIHQSGLPASIPFYNRTLEKKAPSQWYYAKDSCDIFTMRVANGLWARPDIKDSVWKWTIKCSLLPKNKQGINDYVYSDLNFLILQKLVEKIAGESIDSYLERELFKPLKLQNITYQPLSFMPIDIIAPTTLDSVFRKVQLRGFVDDELAAMMGGISGNAGLFSNAFDLAVVMQMNVNFGTYDGKKYLDSSTIALFTKKQLNSQRGLGWHKPNYALGNNGPTSLWATTAAFGHSGFTGTCAWADPTYNLVYVFLSNRVYPSRANNKLVQQNYRTKVMDYVYKSILRQFPNVEPSR